MFDLDRSATIFHGLALFLDLLVISPPSRVLPCVHARPSNPRTLNPDPTFRLARPRLRPQVDGGGERHQGEVPFHGNVVHTDA
jgi:hypothetical protein